MSTGMREQSGWIVVPAFNEEHGLARFVAQLRRTLAALAAQEPFRFTILLVDDGSTDATAALAADLARADAAGIPVRTISLIRNFGHQAALVAGLLEASADADFVVTMDADGEHPVELVPQLVAHWSAGANVVHTLRRPHRELSVAKRVTSDAYYRVLRRMSGLAIRPGMADFKLWDGELLRQIRATLPTCGSTRALAVWLSPDGPAVPFDQAVIPGRRSRFSGRRMWSLAVEGIVQHAELPLRFAILIGIATLVFAMLLGCFAAWAAFTGRTVHGWASTIVAIALFSGTQSLSLGILGEYLLRNVFRRTLPKYVVARRAERRDRDGAVQSGTAGR